MMSAPTAVPTPPASPPSPDTASPDTPSPDPASASAVAARRTRDALDTLRAGLAGTPGRLRVLAAVCVLASLAFALLGASAFRARSTALSAAQDAAAQVVRVQRISTELVQADALATNGFLNFGLEPAAQVAQYDAAVTTASRLLADAARGNPADATALGSVNDALTQYTAQIASARDNNRQGYQVGTAYLRQASALLRSQMLPTLSGIVGANDARAQAEFSAARAATMRLVAAGLGTLVVLLAVQVWLARRSHRVVNLPLAAATSAVVVALLAGGTVMVVTQSRAAKVQRTSYAATLALAQARIAAYDAKSNESLTLIARGTGQAYEEAYQTRLTQIQQQLGKAAGVGVAPTARNDLSAWDTVHQRIRTLDDGGNWDDAKTLAIGSDPNSANAKFDTFAATTRHALDEQAAAVADRLASARTLLLVTGLLTLLLGVLAAAAAWWGVSLRLEEYR
jgi:hypothetical protein